MDKVMGKFTEAHKAGECSTLGGTHIQWENEIMGNCFTWADPWWGKKITRGRCTVAQCGASVLLCFAVFWFGVL